MPEDKKNSMVLKGTVQRDTRRPERNPEVPLGVTPDGSLRISTPGDKGVIRLTSKELTGSNTTVYKAGGRVKDVSCLISNSDNTARTVTVYHVPSGGSAGDDNILCKTYSIPASKSISILGIGMSTGETIEGLASATSALTITVYGTPV